MSRTGHKEFRDMESGGTATVANNNGQEKLLSSTMLEASNELRRAFIKKVYSILSVQLILTAAGAATVNLAHPVSHFLFQTTAGFAVSFVSFILPFILLHTLFAHHQRHPVALLLLGRITVSIGFMMGLCCAHTKGMIVLEAAILTGVVAVSLTLYTFWVVKRGCDFSFLGPFLFVSYPVLVVSVLIQVLCPIGKLSANMIYGCLGSNIFSGYIIYHTNNLIKRFNCDECIWTSVFLYQDVINLFFGLLNALHAADI